MVPLRCLVISSTLCLATGCMATFAESTPEKRFELKGRPSLSISVVSETIQLNNAAERVAETFVSGADYSEGVISALRACDCFSEIKIDSDAMDLQASVRVSRIVHNQSTLLTLGTAMLIPAFEDRQTVIQVRVRDAESNTEARAERIRDIRVWYQLFLLPIYPFRSPAAFEMTLFPQMVREAVTEAASQVLVVDSTAGGRNAP